MPDFFDLSRHFTPEERTIQKTVRGFVDARVMPVIADHFERGTFPTDLIPEIAGLGLLGCNLHGYGCAGLSEVGYGLVMQELERGDSGIRSFASVQGGLVMYPIHAFGSDAQKERYLPKMAKGEIIGCFGLTEPDWGSNPSGMRTVAIDDGDSFVLNGTKRWITNGNLAEVALVWAKVGGASGEVRGFLVPTETKGFEARLIHKKMSLRASVTSELILEDVRIPKDAILPNVRGMKGPLSCLTAARYGIAWGVIGAASSCFDCAVDYAQNRVQFAGKPIAGHQLVQAKFAEMLTQITSSQLMALEVARLKDEKKLRPQHVSMIKRHNVRAALEIARVCRDILGGNGITLEYPIMRHLCNLETVFTYEGTHDIHTLILGQDVTGIAAFELKSLYDAPDLYAMLSEQSRDHDVMFYADLARERGATRILEYGVGAGRIAIALARAGHHVVGIERSAPMLARLCENVAREDEGVRARLAWHHGDAEDVALDASFDLVMFPFNGLAEIVADVSIARVLSRVRGHLAGGGAFAFDVLVPDPALVGASFVAPFFRDPRTGAASRCSQHVTYDAGRNVLTTTTSVRDMERDAADEVLALSQRQLSPDETKRLVEASGFEIVWQTDRFATPNAKVASEAEEALASDAIAYVCRANP